MDKNFDSFDNYAMKFDLKEKMIAYKYQHSYRVMKECNNIAKYLKLTDEGIYLAEVIGLLHDIGRFHQWTEYKTFNDGKYFDHADYGVKILFQDNLIKDYDVDKSYYDIISVSIKNHNKYKIDESVKNKEELLYSKIIRDADKLDILYAFSNPRILELEEDDKDVSKELKEAFFKHKQISYNKLDSKNDRIIGLVAFIYDLNFQYSKDKILNDKYLDSMYRSLKNKKLFKEYFDEAKKYLKEVN